MSIDEIIIITNDALFCVIKVSAPVLLISLVVGLAISIFQTVTSIQEQTLTFVPKILSIFVALMVMGHWMLNEIVVFIENLWSSFSIYIR